MRKKVVVSPEVYEILDDVRRSGLVNMLDYRAVAQVCEAIGERDVAAWIVANRRDYARGILYGFTVEATDE